MIEQFRRVNHSMENTHLSLLRQKKVNNNGILYVIVIIYMCGYPVSLFAC